MRKHMFKTIKSLLIIMTLTGIAIFSTRAADPQAATGTSGDQTTTQSTSGDHSAKSFIKQAERDNQTQIDLASVGMAKAQNENLKAFCQEIQKDHAQANKDLQPIAQTYGVVAGDLPKRSEREANKFEKESSGPEFDKEFATKLLKDHQKAIAKFERAASKLQEADVRQYAENMLPKLRHHLQRAETVAQEVGVDQATISSIMSKAAAVGGTSETQESGTGAGTSGQAEQGSGAKQLQPTPPSSQP
jgi:putative membrane protein